MKEIIEFDDELSKEWLNFLVLRTIDQDAEKYVMDHLRSHVKLGDDELRKVLDIMHDILAEEFVVN